MSKYLDSLNSFVIGFRSNLSAFDIKEFKENASYLKESSVVLPELATVLDPNFYCNYIDKTLDNLNSVTTSVEEMDEFFSKVYKSASLANRNITIPLHADNEVEKIRPEYLTTVALDFDAVTRAILRKEIRTDQIRKKYVSDEYFDKVKKSLVKTSITVTDVRDLMKMDSPTMVKVNNMYLQNNVIPFIRSYTQNVKELTVIGSNIKGRISETYDTIKSIISTLNSMQVEGKIDQDCIKSLNFYKYNFIRGYMNLCAYLSGMFIRKTSCYTYNMMAYVNLYNMIYNYFPEGELILHESVINCDLSDIDDSTLVQSIIDNDLNVIIPHIQNAIGKKKMEIANLMASRYNYRLIYDQEVSSEKYPYDIFPYAAANKIIIAIADDLRVFEESIRNDGLVVDEVIEKSNLEETFVTKYGDILAKISNVDYYITQGSINVEADNGAVTLSLFNDIDHYEKNIKIISNNIHKVYTYLHALQEKYSLNETQMDNAKFSEINSFMEQLMKRFKDFILILTKKFLERLDNLTDALDETELPTVSNQEEYVPYDYSFGSFEEAYSDIEASEKVVLEAMYREYYALWNNINRGVKIVYEDVTETNNSNSTTPTVNTDANNQHNQKGNTSNTQQTQNTAQNTGNTNQANNNGQKENIVQKFVTWIKGVIDKFKNKSKDMSTKNNQWLANVKDDILGLNYENTTITLAKYEGLNSEKISTDITSAINQINSITPNNIPNELKGGRSKAELFIFKSIPEKIDGTDGFPSRIKQFFTHGKTNKSNLVTYSGDDAKQKAQEMIEFCEGYTNMYTKIASDLDRLSKAAADKQEEIINALQSGNHNNVNESVLFEANQNEVKVDKAPVSGSDGSKESINASSVITTIVRDYTGAILTVVEKKYLDYIKVLDKLAPKKNTNKEPEKTSNEESEENNTQESSNNDNEEDNATGKKSKSQKRKDSKNLKEIDEEIENLQKKIKESNNSTVINGYKSMIEDLKKSREKYL
jgi:hypothetical protein